MAMSPEKAHIQATSTLRGQVQLAASAVDGCEDFVSALERAIEGPKPQAVERIPDFRGSNEPIPETPLTDYVTRLLDSINALRNRLESLTRAIG